jgi:hypothetical protein
LERRKSIDGGICPCLMLLSVERSIFIISFACVKFNFFKNPAALFYAFGCAAKIIKLNALFIFLLKGSL